MSVPRSPLRRGSTLIALTVLALVGGSAGVAAASDHPTVQADPIHRYGRKPLDRRQARPLSASTLAVGSSASTGVVTPTPRVYLVFWGSQWSRDPAGAASDLQNLFRGLDGSADNWGTIMNQYCEGVPAGTTTCGKAGIHIQHPASSPLAGTWFDNGAKAPTNASGAQIQAEAVRAAQHFGNTSQSPNLNAQYVIASASGTHPDGFPGSGFCAWHSSGSSQFGTIGFTNLPYVPDSGAGACTTLGGGRLLDGYESTETHEYAESVTDIFPAAGWNGGNGEIGDACIDSDRRITLSTGSFDVQGLWSNDLNRCTTSE
ncbi:MAG TPA: hypothetical protein VJT31_16520 [Rugosimonospora sp.]|nr:hypothetical protein [Rugosimonospora sp.]